MSGKTAKSMEERVGRIEARIALADLANRYCRLLDHGRFDAVAALFTEDAVFSYPGGSVRGRDVLPSFFAEQLGRYEAWWHYLHGHVVDILDDATAVGSVDAHAEHAQDGACVVAGIRYDDRYRRDGDDWRFSARALQIRYFLPWEKFQHRYRHNAAFPPPPSLGREP